jgi:hypothetical protein
METLIRRYGRVRALEGDAKISCITDDLIGTAADAAA